MKKSNQSLDEHEIRLLQRDLNFTVTPDSISLTSSGGRRVCLLVCKNRGEADIIRYKCVLLLKNSKPPKSNISAEERRTMKTLKLDKDIMSLSLKKVGWLSLWINQNIKRRPDNCWMWKKTYRKERKDPTKKYARNLTDCLQTGSTRDKIPVVRYQSFIVYQKYKTVSDWCMASLPLRPIVSSRGWITYCNQYSQICRRHYQTHSWQTGYELQNTRGLFKKIRTSVWMN